MKKHTIQALALALMAVLLLGSCDLINNFIASRTRNIAVIQIYNSNHVKTNKLQPNDTLYVEVQGLKAGGYYKVECLDPLGKVITMMTAVADDSGIIAPAPLWYDVGFKQVWDSTLSRWVAKLPTDTELGLSAFNIHVQSLDQNADSLTMTDFKLPFFVIYNTDISRPQPIVMAGRKVGGEFVLENAFEAGDELYVKVANLDSLPTPEPASGKANIYIVPFDAGFYGDGQIITNKVLIQEATVQELTDGVKITATADSWAGGNSWATIPGNAKGKAFSVIVDVNDNGIFEVLKEGTTDYYLDGIDGNGVAGFIVKQDPIIPPVGNVDYIPANIASGGVTWGHFWFENWPEYDYRDSFNSDGSGTQYGWDWQFGGYGVKALWNPYLSHDPQVPNSDETSLYYGKYVDVYIVKANDGTNADDMLDLTGQKTIVPVTGTYKMTMPVQYACTNGANQQTIWRASSWEPMTVGNYCVVVDVDQNGKVSDGDLVDNLHKTEATPTDGIGFSVVTP